MENWSCQSKKIYSFQKVYFLVVGFLFACFALPGIAHAAVLDWNCDPGKEICYIFPTADATEKSEECFDKAVSKAWGTQDALQEGELLHFEIPIENTGAVPPVFACSNCGTEGSVYRFYTEDNTGIFEINLEQKILRDTRAAVGTSPYYYARFLLSATVTNTVAGVETSETIYANLCAVVKKPAQVAPPTQPTTKAPVVDVKSTFPSITDLNPLRATSVPTLFGRGITILLGVLGSIAILIFIYGGMLWMTSMGNADKAGKALKTIVWGAMGVFVIFASYAVVHFVLDAFK